MTRNADRAKRGLPGLAPAAMACALAWTSATPLPVAAQDLPREVQVGTQAIKDYEFDSARDGVYCPSCNYGAGNSRLSYIDGDHNLWVGYVDFDNGYFYPSDGKAVLVDTNTVTATEIGNGPEWVDSKLGSQLVYTRWTDGRSHTVPFLQLGMARAGGDGWIAGPIPDSSGRVLPVGTDNPSGQYPFLHFQSFTLQARDTTLYWRGMYPGSTEVALPVTSSQAGVTRRWVPGGRDIIITAQERAIMPAQPATLTSLTRQVFLYHASTGTIEQLTFDDSNKYWAFMWAAPEFDNEKVFVVMVGGDRLQIYRSMDTGNGDRAWTVIKTITMPEATPYVSSPEPFVYDGKSWISFSLSSDPNGRHFTQPSVIAISGIVPGVDELRVLTSADDPPRVRRDPEYFITAKGPYIYYNRYLPETDSRPAISEGVFRVDTQLGPCSDCGVAAGPRTTAHGRR